MGSLDERFDPFNKFITGVNVNARIFVGKWFIGHYGVAYWVRTL
jgi:hypothetical protein